MGVRSTAKCIQGSQVNVDNYSSSCIVQSTVQHNTLSWCIINWTWSYPTLVTARRRTKTSRVCFQIYNNWAAVCPNRKGSLGAYLGVWTLFWLPDWPQVSHSHGSQTASTSLQHEMTQRTSATRSAILSSNALIPLHNLAHPGKILSLHTCCQELQQTSQAVLIIASTRKQMSLLIQWFKVFPRVMHNWKLEQEQDNVCKQIMVYCRDGWPAKHGLEPYTLTTQYRQKSQLQMVYFQHLCNWKSLTRFTQAIRALLSVENKPDSLMARVIQTAGGACKELSCMCDSSKTKSSTLGDVYFPRPTLVEGRRSLLIYLIVDYYSRFIEVARVKWTAEKVIQHTKSIFTRHGIPEVVISNNGPQYSADAYSLQEYQFQHITISQYYSQSNGEAERVVETLKHLLNKGKDPYLAIPSYRSTPLQNGYTPSELLMNRKLRTTVPTTREQRKPEVPDQQSLWTRKKINRNQKRNFDSRRGVRDLPELEN